MPPKPTAKNKAGAGADAAAEGDKGEAQQQAFLQQSLQASVATLKERVRDLEESNGVLRRTRTRMGKETQDFVSYFQTELEQRDAKIEQLRDALRTTGFEGAKAVKRLQVQMETQREELEAAAKAAQQSLRDRVAELQEQVDALDHYKMHKAQIDAQVAGLAEALASEKASRREEVAEVERRWMLDKKSAIDDRKVEYASMKRRARQEAQSRLDEDVKRIVIESKKATEELRFLREQTRILKREAAALTGQNQVLAREVEIAADQEREYATQAARREGQRREMQARIHALESSVGAMAREYERRRADDVAAAGHDSEDLAMEVGGLRTLVRMKNQELKTVRRLAQAILAQRTEVEQFLVEAMTEVKAELRQRRVERRKQRARAAELGAGGLHLPAIVGVAAATNGAPGGVAQSPVRASAASGLAGDVTLADLSLEDRERILSLLFAKINTAEAGEPGRAGAASAGGRGLSAARGSPAGGGRVSKLSVGGGFGGIGRPFGLDADVPEQLPGDAGGSSPPLPRPTAGDSKEPPAADDDALVAAGPLASALLAEEAAAFASSASAQGAGLA